MKKAKQGEIKWLLDVEDHDYPAAESYLSLLYSKSQVRKMMTRFKRSPVVQFKAKDIFRASRLSLLGVSNSHIEKDREKIRKRQSIAPLLLVRDQQNGEVVIADGYHRLCAIYELDEDASIPCKII
jgi:disulfide oxidoreductase YuzD